MALTLVPPVCLLAQSSTGAWNGYAQNAQHTANAANGSQSLNRIHWLTPVDTNVPSGEIFIHYGSPMVTAAGTVLVPVKILNGSNDAFKVQAFAPGVTGTSPAPLYELPTEYMLPPHNWTPPYGPTLSGTRLYYPGPGGTVYYRDQVDSAAGPDGQPYATGQIAFYGNGVYTNPDHAALFNSNVQISTPLVADSSGNIYFGFVVSGDKPANLVSGLARISSTGVGSWISAQAASGGDSSINAVASNCAPALSNDQSLVYFAVTNGSGGYLVSVNSTTLAPAARVQLIDPNTGNGATLNPDSTASPMVGPDGDVYFGVLENPCCTSHNDRGWLLHFNSALTQIRTPGSFGWDTTPSVVPSKLAPGYTGASSYLVLTKYNNYLNAGTGDGVNKVALLDPNELEPDPIVPSVIVMKEIQTITGPTANGPAPAVREWCINTAAIDPVNKAAIVNSEDGNVYRWSFASGTLTGKMQLNAPLSEAYTPTVIGPDGTVYAINDAVLYALGN